MKAMLRSLYLAGLVLLLAAPAAGAEVQRPHETITIGFPAADDFFVYALLYPQKQVAVLNAETESDVAGASIWLGTSYVERVPRNSFGDTIHVDFGSLGRLDGRFVADVPPHVGHLSRSCRGRRPTSQNGYFGGKFVFSGDGGYLNASTHRAQIAVVRRSYRLQCKKGHAAQFRKRRPGLFGYVEAPTGSLSNSDGTYLHTILRSENLVTEFMALDHFHSDTVGFKAAAREWLPGDIATTRWAAIGFAPEKTFVLGEPERRPDFASVQPPPPFSGTAEYTRSLGTLDGDLTASFLGKELPLAGPGSEGKICARPDPSKLWRCD